MLLFLESSLGTPIEYALIVLASAAESGKERGRVGADPSRKSVTGLSHTGSCHRNCPRQRSGGLTLKWGAGSNVNGALHWEGAQKTHRANEGSQALCKDTVGAWQGGWERS